MLYEVPRLAEEEAKIVGPLNAKQFFILVGVFVICALMFYLFRTTTAIIISLVIIALTLFITFGKIGNRPITAIITNIIKQIWNPSLYVFRKKEPTIKELYPEITKKIEQESQITTKVARSTKEDIKNLAKQLDKN
jgi:signal transduction histidine kinase